MGFRAVAAMLVLLVQAQALAAQDTTGVRITAGGVLVDFQDADLRAVITALAEAGNLNVTYGDVPQRRVTLRLRQPVARGDILPLLRSIAQSNGLTVVEDGGILRFEAVGAQTGRVGQAAVGAAAQQAQKRLYVYRLRHARAVRLAQTLQTVFGSASVMPPGTEMRTRPLSEYLRDQAIRPFVPADTAVISVVQAGQIELGGSLRADVQIVPDENTNSLIIRATPEDYEIVRQAIEVVDLRPLQVLIEVLIAEVRLSRGVDVGVSASATRTRGSDTTSGILSSISPQDFIFRITRGGRVDLEIALAALRTRGDVRIISRPLIFAQNNLEARILVGSQRPFVQVFRSLPTDAAVRDQVVQYRDVGTSLAIIPTINPDGYVTMQVSQEVSSATNETQFGAPIISTREATTHLFVKDGQTAVFGGLVDQQRERVRSGIPGLMDIPVLGFLFGTTRWSTANSELFLFLTPHVVQSDDDLERLRRELEQRSPGSTESVIPPAPRP